MFLKIQTLKDELSNQEVFTPSGKEPKTNGHVQVEEDITNTVSNRGSSGKTWLVFSL